MKTRNAVGLLLIILIWTSAGCGKDDSTSTSHAPTPPPVHDAAPPNVPPPPPPTSAPPVIPPPVAAAQELPKAEDVLPPGEVSKGSLVVNGDGFRYQVKPIYKPVEHPKSKFAYRATVNGIIGPADITLYAYKEAFPGDLDALVKRETEAVTSAGGKVLENMEVRLRIAGTLGSGYRFFARVDKKLDLYVLGVHEGQAYIFHAETPDQNNPWPNVGSDMMIRGSTFHAAPPAK